MHPLGLQAQLWLLRLGMWRMLCLYLIVGAWLGVVTELWQRLEWVNGGVTRWHVVVTGVVVVQGNCWICRRCDSSSRWSGGGVSAPAVVGVVSSSVRGGTSMW